MTIGIAVLAAGSSTRMGGAKQLLPWNGTTLLRGVVAEALAAGLGPVAVIMAAGAEDIAREIRGEPVIPLMNPGHRRGQGASVHVAAGWAAAEGFDALILALGDQPFVRHGDYAQLAACIRGTGAPAAGAAYDDGAGVPAIFTRAWFPRLLIIPADQGAKTLLRIIPGGVTIRLSGALTDIDTPADYRAACESRPLQPPAGEIRC